MTPLFATLQQKTPRFRGITSPRGNRPGMQCQIRLSHPDSVLFLTPSPLTSDLRHLADQKPHSMRYNHQYRLLGTSATESLHDPVVLAPKRVRNLACLT